MGTRIDVGLKQLRQGVSIKTNQSSVLKVAARVPMLEMEEANFHTDSAVVLPDVDPRDLRLAENDRITGLSVIAATILFAETNPEKQLLITGHTDTKASESHNLELSVDRADGVLFVLTGQKDAWVALSDRRHNVEDYQQILRWIAVTWRWPCDPGPIDNEHGPKTERAVRAFQQSVKDLLGRELAVDGKVGPEVWGEFFDIYMAALARLLGVDETKLPEKLESLSFADPARVGCGESFPKDNPGADEFESSTNRRVELYFFDPVELPKLDCHASGGACNKSACDLYRGIYLPQPLPAPAIDLGVLDGMLPLPDPMLGPLRSLVFSYDERILEAAEPGASFISQGEQGVAVSRAQAGLRLVGCSLPESHENGAPDGEFGDETLAAVQEFQTSFPELLSAEIGEETKNYLKHQPQPLKPDGALGAKTLHALDALLLDRAAAKSAEAAEPASAKGAKSLVVVPASVVSSGVVVGTPLAVPNRCGLVGGSPTFSADLEACFVKELNARRPALNLNNLTRTEFYSRYAARHPEVPWSLLASLVSRNAGYNFTDIERYRMLSGLIPPLPFVGVSAQISLLFIERFLESGNFLIFNDVFPQLLAYELAKEAFLDTGDSNCQTLLLSLTRIAGVEAEVSLEWFNFFNMAVSENFFVGRSAPSTDPRIVRHSVGLISNEQNYLEHHLMDPVPGTPLYMDHPFMPVGKTAVTILTDVVFPVMARLKLTRLVFSSTPTGPAATASEIFQHFVGNFANVDDRIDTGRELYFGVFMAAAARRNGIDRFQKAVPHSASRVDYDSDHFTKSLFKLPLALRYLSPELNLSNFPVLGFPGPPPVALPTWGARNPARVTRFRSIVGSPLARDAFAPPLGRGDPAGATRVPSEVLI
jgi:peptidoglycan hydrolase-like protein with peptidoglycan-binding domain